MSRLVIAATLLGVAACGPSSTPGVADGTVPSLAVAREPSEGERHLTNIRQLTDGGENAEAYFSADGRRLIFQSTRDGRSCDQQYVINVDGTGLRRVSTGTGKTTCGFFLAGDRKILYASSHAVDTACPPRPDPSLGYVWGLDPFDLYIANPDGSGLKRLTNYGVYTAEGTVAPDGRTIVFTSLKDGDLDLYRINSDGTGLQRLTDAVGYDGGAFFSADGRQIVWRAWHPTDSAELAAYRSLLARKLVRPNRMEIWVMNADGTGKRQVTNLGGANWAPFFTPDGRRIVFSTNHHVDRRSGNFDLFLINVDGSGLEQVTYGTVFDGFPQFSRDGKRLVWASNRHARNPRETNVFVADWRD